ncbi:MAG: YqaE/Pmp3 family membrane protein [Cytophagales bacterium]|nr:YqaE/Pmp3 family membrane protein [Cytophagales bacterium]
MWVLAVILCVLIPPLGVFLLEGDFTTHFLIDLILTLLFFLPGVIYALLVAFNVI